METITSPANSNPQGPDAGATEQSAVTPEKLLYNGQEMEVDSFLKSRKHRVKVDGKESEVDFDELLKGYSHGSAANARMREASEAKKELESVRAREKAILDSIGAWKTKPESLWETAERFGVDVDALAHERVLKKMQYEMMSDDERAHYERDQKLSQYEARDKAEAEAKQKQEIERMRQHAVTDLENNILAHLEKAGGSVSPAIVGRAIDAMITAMNAGEDLSIEQAFQRANGWYSKERDGIFNEHLQALLAKGEVPKELAEAVRKADMAALKRQPPKRHDAPVTQTQEKKSVGVDDFFGNLERKFKK